MGGCGGYGGSCCGGYGGSCFYGRLWWLRWQLLCQKRRGRCGRCIGSGKHGGRGIVVVVVLVVVSSDVPMQPYFPSSLSVFDLVRHGIPVCAYLYGSVTSTCVYPTHLAARGAGLLSMQPCSSQSLHLKVGAQGLLEILSKVPVANPLCIGAPPPPPPPPPGRPDHYFSCADSFRTPAIQILPHPHERCFCNSNPSLCWHISCVRKG